jgi:AraC-like DNA-binding protein
MITEVVNDLTAFYLTASPPEDLRDFIGQYFEDDLFSGKLLQTGRERLLPFIGFELRFNFSEPFIIEGEGIHYQVNRNVLLPRNHTWILHQSRHTFGIRIHFSFLPYLLGKSQEQFQQRPMPLDHLIEPLLVRDLEQARTFRERVDRCNEYFSEVYEAAAPELDKARFVIGIIDQLLREKFDFRVDMKGAQQFVSQKTLYRHFIRNLGIPPNECSRILRMRSALHYYFHRRWEFDPMEFGYYDDSHFHKEVKAITGLRLSELKNGTTLT